MKCNNMIIMRFTRSVAKKIKCNTDLANKIEMELMENDESTSIIHNDSMLLDKYKCDYEKLEWLSQTPP